MTLQKRSLALLLAFLFAIAPVLLAPSTAHAAEYASPVQAISNAKISADENISTASTFFYDEVGDFSSYMIDTLTIPYSTRVRVSLILKYPDNPSGTVTVEIYNANGTHYLNKVVSASSSSSWTFSIPAGTYTVLLVSGNNHVTYGMLVADAG